MDSIGYVNSLSASALSGFGESRFEDSIDKASTDLKSGDNKSAEASAQEFEGLFVGQLLRLMFETVEVDETFGGGFSEETFRGLLVDEYGKSISKSGGIGVAENVLAQLNSINQI